MTLEQIYYIAEIVAVVGIMVSVVLVLIQLRQTPKQLEKNQVATELANELNVSQNVHDIFLKLVEDEELRRVLRKGRQAEERLTGEEVGLYSAFAFAATFIALASNMAWVNGMATDEMKSSHSASVCDY